MAIDLRFNDLLTKNIVLENIKSDKGQGEYGSMFSWNIPRIKVSSFPKVCWAANHSA